MKHFKKIFAVALACVMMLTVLTGCGKTVKNYREELSERLAAANIGVRVDDQMNKNAETVAKNLTKAVIEAAKGNADYQDIVRGIIKNSNLSDKTQYSVSITVVGQTANIGMDGSQSKNTAAPTDFFVQEMKDYNEKNPNAKLTKAGIGLLHIPLYNADIVVLLAE